tara:strand:- start:37441 stop:38208 length:768 start_codon:yes stop_codon:yes gene_type:complete
LEPLFNFQPSNDWIKLQASVTYRDQWSGFNGNPRSFLGNYGTLLKGKHGLGLSFIAQEIGIQKLQNVVLNYSYRMKIKGSEEHFFTAGIGAGMGMTYFDYSTVSQIVDPYLISGRTTFPRINLGLTYHWNKLTVGLSSTQVNANPGASGNYRPETHFFGMAEYTIDISNSFIVLPRVMYRTDGNVQTAEMNLMATYLKKYSLGFGLRNTNAYSFSAQIDLKEKFRIGYAYEVTNSKLNNGILNPTHEFVLGFLLK